MFKRIRYQFGWLRRKSRKRGPDVWVWVYRSTTPAGKRKENSVIVGSVQQYPSEADAWKAAEGLASVDQQSNSCGRDNFRSVDRPLYPRGNSQAPCDTEPLPILAQESHQASLGECF